MRPVWPSELSMFTFHKPCVIWVERNTGSCVSKEPRPNQRRRRWGSVIPGTFFLPLSKYSPFLSIFFFFPCILILMPWDEIHSNVMMNCVVKPIKPPPLIRLLSSIHYFWKMNRQSDCSSAYFTTHTTTALVWSKIELRWKWLGQ